jgi:hypothetical protein
MKNQKRSLTQQEDFFLPWFLTKAMRTRVEKLLPRYYHLRLRMYYKQYGCISCRKKTLLYGANALCKNCYAVVGDRLRRTDRRLQVRVGHEQDGVAEAFLRRLESAKDLLADLKGVV